VDKLAVVNLVHKDFIYITVSVNIHVQEDSMKLMMVPVNNVMKLVEIVSELTFNLVLNVMNHSSSMLILVSNHVMMHSGQIIPPEPVTHVMNHVKLVPLEKITLVNLVILQIIL